MKTLMGIFLIGHLIADFLLQSATMADLKKEKKKYWIGHSAIYAVIFIALSFVCLTPKIAIMNSAIIAITHCIVDYLRIIIDKKKSKKSTNTIRVIYNRPDYTYKYNIYIILFA